MDLDEQRSTIKAVDIALEHLQLIAAMYTSAPVASEIAKEALVKINEEMLCD